MRSFILFVLVLSGLSLQLNGQKKSSLLWEISGNGLKKKSYLYGTMHVSNKIAFHLGDTFFIALEKSDLVCLESDPGKWIEEMYSSDNGSMMVKHNSYYGYNKSNFYENLVSFDEPEKKDLEKALRQKHSLENGFLYRGSNYNEEYEENTYLDLFIYQYARKNKIDVLNLEDFEETNRLQILSMLPDEDEDEDEEKQKKKNKKSYYSKWNKYMSVREAMEDAYRNGQLDIIDSITKMTSKSDMYLHYFLHERNKIMAKGIDTLAKDKSIFIGIGAAHLPGEKGVINLLKEKGYTLRPIVRNKSVLAKKKKNDIEKIFLDIPYQEQTTKDGFISLNLPGKLYETNGQSGDLQYFYPDMANGGNFFISRFQTFYPLNETSPVQWQLKIDSLLFENIEGKIIEQEELKVSGFNAIKILNETRKGDYQKRLIVFTPLEIIFFKMSGTGEWAKKYGDQFVNSVKINLPLYESTKYVSHLNDYELTFPGPTINTVHAFDISNSPPKYNVQCYTPSDSSFYLLQTDWLTDFDYIEEDTFELNYLFTVFANQLDSVKATITTEVNENNASGYIVNQNGDSIFLKSFIWKNFYYLLAAKTSYRKAKSFFNSFKLTNNYKEDEYVHYHDTVLRYTVSTPVIPPKMEDLYNYVRKQSASEKKEDWDYIKEYRNFFYKKNYETIKVKYLKHSDYYHFKTLEEFWKDELENYLDGEYAIIKEEYDNNDSTPTSHVIVSDTGSQKVVEIMTIINKGVVYTVRAAYNSAQPRSRFISTFFETFRPDTDTLLGKTITVSNAPMFFADLSSGDSTSIERAVNLTNRITFSKEHVDSMIWYIDNFEFPDDDEEGTANYLIQQLGYIKHPAIVKYLKEKYESSTDDFERQFSVLKALAKYGTKKSYMAMNKLILQEPPITRNENPIETFFYYLDDSLSLTSKLYPDIWDLMLYKDYRESVYSISAMLLDSGLIKASSYKREKPLILREAKGTTTINKSGYNNSHSSSVRLKDTDIIWSFGNKHEYPISTIDQYAITGYLKLLMPYYKKDKKVSDYVNSLLVHEDMTYRFVATIMLTEINQPVHDSLYLNLSKSPDFRFAFYKALKFIGKEEKFSQDYLSQEQLMESAVSASSSIDEEDSLKFVQKRYIKNKYDEGYVYFFKHQSDHNNKWYIHYAGLQPKDTTQINSKTDLDYIERKASSVYTEHEINKEIDDWVKYLNLIGRERAANKSSSEYSYYD
tara:strand:+ start:14005 stop:17661 length:3657 start_codon:yes stop_codon:yes gene_type:complete